FFLSSRRRHTRLVSDWSSDVCSSDLELRRAFRMLPPQVLDLSVGVAPFGHRRPPVAEDSRDLCWCPLVSRYGQDITDMLRHWVRSEERRVGKECRGRGAQER